MNSFITQWECDDCGWVTDSPEDQAHSRTRCLGASVERQYIAVDTLLSDEEIGRVAAAVEQEVKARDEWYGLDNWTFVEVVEFVLDHATATPGNPA